MHDLISRQAAIDALRNRWLKTINFDGIGEDIAEECEICLRTVPSAQPDVPDTNVEDLISRQGVLDYIDAMPSELTSDGRRMVRRITLTEYIADTLPSAQPEPQWIPVSERMPRDGTWNIFTDGKNISVERYKADAFDHFFPNGRWFQLEDVIAWMPLPEPYKGGEKDE